MAEGRMLSKRISRSEKVAALKNDTHRMIYTWLIAYLDVEGRMEVNPALMKADIAPLLDHITAKNLSDILVALHDIGLIILYSINGKEYLQLTQFDEHQKNLRKDKEAPCKIPALTPESVRTNSGPTPELVPPKIKIKIKRREEEENSQPSDVGLTLSSLLLEKIKSRNNNFKEPNLETWGKDIDLMISRDARDPNEIKEVICWCQEDSFWRNNILSPGKLRKQYDQLVLKMNDLSQFDPKPRKDNVSEWLLESQPKN